VTSLDASVGVNYRFTKDVALSARVEAFNVFNSQRPAAVSFNYTTSFAGPIIGASQGSVPTQYGGLCSATVTSPAGVAAATCAQGNGSLPVPRVDPNSPTGNAIRVGLPNAQQQLRSMPTNIAFGKPTAFQAVRQFRFSLRMSF
jgi:hypothetical protein